MFYALAQAFRFRGRAQPVPLSSRSAPAAAVVTALVIMLDLMPRLIALAADPKQGKGQPIRSDGPASHLVAKKGTPTMGGLGMLIAVSDLDFSVDGLHEHLRVGVSVA